MDAIRIVNLRSLEDTNYVKIKPLTILVGQNSSGKSTFLRTFPLLRQSVEERTTGPILWFGRYVDFGSFQEALRVNSTPEEIALGFKFCLPTNTKSNLKYLGHGEGNHQTVDDEIEATIKIQNNRTHDEGFVSSIDLIINKNESYKICINPDGTVDDLEINKHHILMSDVSSCRVSTNSLFPLLRYKESHLLRSFISDEDVSKIFKNRKLSNDERILLIELINQSYSSGSETNLEYFINENEIGTSKNIIQLLNQFNIKVSNEQFKKIELSNQLTRLTRLLRDSQYYYSSLSKTCTYIAPVRATAERFYRPQNLSVDDVDFQGKNLAVFLRSLSAQEIKDFNKWTEEYFYFSAHVRMAGGQLSIFIKEGGQEQNLTDTGFGYSQVLPVITQLWSLIQSKINTNEIPLIFSIEQPELHLHPRLQARLTDAFINAVRMSNKEGINLRLIIETHSATIVNRLGHRVSNSDISPDDINIAIFNKENPASPTKVTFGEFGQDGYMQNWPYGFFEPD